jgi:HSP20 family molecular chaperone IbpA
MKKIIFLIFLNCTPVLARSDSDEMQRQINELMKARDEMFRSLLNDSGDHNFEKKFEDLVNQIEKNSFTPRAGFDSDIPGAVFGEYDWRESDTAITFVLKVTQIKNKPLSIKIEKGEVKLKGDVESIDEDSSKKRKNVSRVHFERSFTIPDGVDQTAPEFDNKSGELLIKFFKKNKINKKNERLPIEKNSNDTRI